MTTVTTTSPNGLMTDSVNRELPTALPDSGTAPPAEDDREDSPPAYFGDPWFQERAVHAVRLLRDSQRRGWLGIRAHALLGFILLDIRRERGSRELFRFAERTGVSRGYLWVAERFAEHADLLDRYRPSIKSEAMALIRAERPGPAPGAEVGPRPEWMPDHVTVGVEAPRPPHLEEETEPAIVAPGPGPCADPSPFVAELTRTIQVVMSRAGLAGPAPERLRAAWADCTRDERKAFLSERLDIAAR